MRTIAILMLIALVMPMPVLAQDQATGQITGEVTAGQRTLPNVVIQIRDLTTGALVFTTGTDSKGSFDFRMPPGHYAVEVVNVSGNIIGVSAPIELTAGATFKSGVSLPLSSEQALSYQPQPETNHSKLRPFLGIIAMLAGAVILALTR